MYRSISEIVDLKIDDILTLSEQELIDNIEVISNKIWFDAIKLGTETEDNSYEEIKYVRELFPNNKIKIKIGGAGCKNDIRKCFQYNIDGIILPMAESTYAIEHFLNHYNYFSNKFNREIPLTINIETIETVKKLHDLLPLLQNFYAVTIGRSDLSRSVYNDVNSKEVFELVEQIIFTIKEKYNNMNISIGGVITPDISKYIYNNYNVSLINTKFAYVKPDKDISDNIYQALYFEILLYALFYKQEFKDIDDFKTFFNNNIKRLNK